MREERESLAQYRLAPDQFFLFISEAEKLACNTHTHTHIYMMNITTITTYNLNVVWLVYHGHSWWSNQSHPMNVWGSVCFRFIKYFDSS